MLNRLIAWGNTFSIGNRKRTLWQEIGMQLIEQPGHYLITYLPCFVACLIGGATGVGIVAATAAIFFYREGRQYPSSRWYDPWLDGCVGAAGLITALAMYWTG